MGSNPGFVDGQIPTAAQWNSYFTAKLDDLGYLFAQPTGGTLTAAIGQGGFLLDPPTELAALLVELPPAARDEQVFWVSSSQTIDAFTAAPAAGQSVSTTATGPFVLGQNGKVAWMFRAANTTWYGQF